MSDPVRPHRRQPTRLPRPWDSPGKNTGVGCHFLLQCMKVKSESEVAQSCSTLCDPTDCSLLGFSAYGIFQARVLEWGAIAFSSSQATHYLIMYFITWILNFIMKMKRHSGGEQLDVSMDLYWCTVLHAYIIIVCEESLRAWDQPRLNVWQFLTARGNQTHWIFVRSIIPLCMIIHWHCPWKGLVSLYYCCFNRLPPPFNSYYFLFEL